MSIDSGTRPRTSGSAILLSFAQSSASRTQSATSSGQRRSNSASGMKAYSPGNGASPCSTMTLALPSWSSASFIARSDPSASPSGFSWVVMTKRSWARIASATAVSSLAVVWGELIDQLRHADPALDRRIVLEGQLRSSLHSKLPREPRLKHRVRRLERGERLHAFRFGAEHRDEDARVAEVGRRFHSGDSDKADTRILQLTDGLGQHLPDRLVDPAHSIRHGGYSSAWTRSCSPASCSGASSPHSRAASSVSCSATSACR